MKPDSFALRQARQRPHLAGSSSSPIRRESVLFIPCSGERHVPFYRKAIIQVDTASWPAGTTIPAPLSTLSQKLQWVSFPHLFAHVAERTAPPSGYGFSLAETWAFLRYFSAISRTSDLSLAHRWRDLDPHQKTILSDDWGMGLASMIATETFQPLAIAHTGEWLKRVRVAEARRPPRHKGPEKSPDFVIEDAQGRYHLVEAKGTQGRTRTLQAAMKDGVEQKKNIEFHHPPDEGSRLVVGTRIPREGDGRVEILVQDPPLFEITPADVTAGRTWLRRTGLAAACQAAGLPSFAAALLDVEGFRGPRASDAGFELEVRTRTIDREQTLAGRQAEIILSTTLEGARAWRVTLGIDAKLLHMLLEARSLDAFILEYGRAELGTNAPAQIDPARVVVSTPNGLTLTMQPL